MKLLDAFFEWTPLERLAHFFVTQIGMSDAEPLRKTAKDLFESYDAFVGLLNDPEKCDRLDKLEHDAEDANVVFREARTVRKQFRLAIQEMFLGTAFPLRQHTIEEGVFWWHLWGFRQAH